MRGGLAMICRLLINMGALVITGLLVDNCVAAAETFHMDMIYRYSDDFKALMDSRNKPIVDWTQKGTPEHHEKLINRDRHRHASRGLISSQSYGSYSLSPTNETATVETLGGLHYSLIKIGTPNLTFLVALDTGSDLLWVPCNCQQCAPTNWASYGLQSLNLDFAVYSQSNSNTSKSVSCSDPMCSSLISSSNCTSANEKCSYVVNYMSSNTSTSGVIVEDVLYLNSEASNGSTVTTPIYFGCGEVQTGDLVENVAPDGLFGLGPYNISVPSTLARSGLVANTFSMCFSSSDLSGRLVFGTQGKEGLQSTPLVSTNPSVYYVVNAIKFTIDGDSLGVSENFIFDTGTSYTTLPESIYQDLGNIFNQKINLTQYQINGSFDYCWKISDSTEANSLPGLTLTFSGGSTWDIATPYVSYSDSAMNLLVYCLGITPSSNAIIGHNFMGGYEFFFNQESMTFSWASSNCYNLSDSVVGVRNEASTTNRDSTTTTSSNSSRVASHSLCTLSFHLILFFTFMTLNSLI